MTETPQSTAEIIPFPIMRTDTGRSIAAEFARRPVKGRYNKSIYADGVLQVTSERLERLGVAPARIAAEVASLESLFSAISAESGAPEQVRA